VPYINSSNLLAFYKTYAPGAYDKTVALGTYDNDGLNYTFLKIKNQIGWEPFKQTFRYFNALSATAIPTTNLGKLNLFLSKLKDYSGTNVFSLLTAQEMSVYQAKFGGTIEYVYGEFTETETYAIASMHLQEKENSSYSIINARKPLYNQFGTLIAFAVPFTDANSTQAGHVVVGATLADYSFFIIDPLPENYVSIVSSINSGYKVIFEQPLYYFVNTSDPDLSAAATALSTMTAQSALSTTSGTSLAIANDNLAEENRQMNLAVLDKLYQSEVSGDSSTITSDNTQSTSSANYNLNIDVRLQSEYESTPQYVKIYENNKYYYGGAQSWWNSIVPRNFMTGSFMASRGCGPVAFANIIAYHISKDYYEYNDLLHYTSDGKYYEDEYGMIVPRNPYSTALFTETYPYNISNKAMSKTTFTDFMDFYADLAEIPLLWGMLDSDMENAFDELTEITGYETVFDSLGSHDPDVVEAYLVEKLSADIPVLMWNVLEWLDGIDANYDTADPEQSFDNHWMTITKYFKQASTGTSWVALSSWGGRYSVNTNLLKKRSGDAYYLDYYYPDFYTAEILPK
jgi:hypothetical protein